MEDLQKLYPIGIQTFSEIQEGNYLYIDKTEYVYRMTHSSSKYMFLSRPRRFGKSLLTSTLHSYFSGRKELFHGLAIEKLEKEWVEYPVLHFDLSMAKHVDKEGLESLLDFMLAEHERMFSIDTVSENANLRLTNLIKRIYEQTGKKVAVLIDEYDAPLLDVVHEHENLGILRNIMRNFYSPLKACDPYLRYVFLTGITKFSQLSIFSELNNIKNISMDEPYAAICGITEDEMLIQMREDIDNLAIKMEISSEEVVQKLKENYDGYHFTYPSPDIYNPFSLLNAFADGKFNSYWFGSGTPTYLIKMLAKSPKIFHIPSYFLKLAFKYISGNIAFQASPVSAAAWFSLPVNARMPQFTDHSTGIRIQFPIYNQSGAHTVRQIYINKILTVHSCAIIFLHDRGTVTLPIKKDWHMTMFLYFPGNFQVMQPIKIRRCQDLTPILIHRPDCADSNPVYLLISQCFHNLIQCMKDVLHQLRCCLFSYRKTNLF